MAGTPIHVSPAKPTQNGFAIRAMREKDGRSVQWLADAVDVSAPHMRNIENENRNVSRVHLHRIARALEVPVAAIVRDGAAELAEAVGQ